MRGNGQKLAIAQTKSGNKNGEKKTVKIEFQFGIVANKINVIKRLYKNLIKQPKKKHNEKWIVSISLSISRRVRYYMYIITV